MTLAALVADLNQFNTGKCIRVRFTELLLYIRAGHIVEYLNFEQAAE